MKTLTYLLLLAVLISCQKENVLQPEIASEGRGSKHVRAMKLKTQFWSPVRAYTYENGMIVRSDFMDNGYNVQYSREERKITLSSHFYMPDQYIYSFGKDGRLKNMKHEFEGQVVEDETYGYRGIMMNMIKFYADQNNQSSHYITSEFLSPWLQRIITTIDLAGTPITTKRDTIYLRQTGAFELTTLDGQMRKTLVQNFSATIMDPEYNIPYTPSFDRINQCMATENWNRGWGLYSTTKFLGRLLLKTTRYDNGPAYPERWLENIVTDGDGLPLSYDEWFTERFKDGWSYSKAIPTTYQYTQLY